MAYSRLPKPGKIVRGVEIGPCKESCDHEDCQATRDQANSECPVCGEKIGYETAFVRHEGSFYHYVCLD